MAPLILGMCCPFPTPSSPHKMHHVLRHKAKRFQMSGLLCDKQKGKHSRVARLQRPKTAAGYRVQDGGDEKQNLGEGDTQKCQYYGKLLRIRENLLAKVIMIVCTHWS